MGKSEIAAKQSVTYLGCILDNKLTGEGMAGKVISKINLKIKFLARINPINQIDRKALEILAGALVHGHLPKILKKKLQTSQNKMVRQIFVCYPFDLMCMLCTCVNKEFQSINQSDVVWPNRFQQCRCSVLCITVAVHKPTVGLGCVPWLTP